MPGRGKKKKVTFLTPIKAKNGVFTPTKKVTPRALKIRGKRRVGFRNKSVLKLNLNSTQQEVMLCIHLIMLTT